MNGLVHLAYIIRTQNSKFSSVQDKCLVYLNFIFVLQVSAYGFMGDTKKFTAHYYDKTKTNANVKIANVYWHDWKKENTLWKLLIDEGIIKMYTRT